MSIDPLLSIADDAGFVFVEAPVQAPRNLERDDLDRGFVIVEVREVLRGTDVLQSLVGQHVTVVSEDPDGIAQSDELILFTDCVSLGDPVLARELGRRSASRESRSEVDQVLAIIAGRPIAQRLTTAQLAVVGEVTNTKRLVDPYHPTSEHDPDWWVARVAVEETLKGSSSRKNVDVLFANSDDIAWYKVPKLHQGNRGIFLLHGWDDHARPPDAPRRALVVTDPLDVQPIERRAELERTLGRLGEEG
jgi:hypothetical protein